MPGRERRQPCLLRSRRKLPRSSGRAWTAGRTHTDRHLPPRGRRREHGGGLWQADRQARNLHGHPGAGRHACEHRRPHGKAGFRADDPVRRAGRARHERPRRLPGSGLCRNLRKPGQACRRTRRSAAGDGARLPRFRNRATGPARPGGRCLAGGRSRRRRRTAQARNRRPRQSGPRPSNVAPDRSAHGSCRASPADSGRHGMDGGSACGDRALGAGHQPAHSTLLPSQGPHRQRASLLCRRSRHRCGAGAAGGDRCCRPGPRARRATGRDSQPGLYAVRAARNGAQTDPHPSRRGGDRPRLAGESVGRLRCGRSRACPRHARHPGARPRPARPRACRIY